MKTVSAVLGLAALILVLGVQLNAMPMTPLNASAVAQQDNSQPPSDSAKPAAVKVFTGKVVQANGQYVLMENTTKTTYALDDQGKAKQFEGETVKVTGTLEAANNLIHVSNIEPAA
jgi:hypothetical protein